MMASSLPPDSAAFRSGISRAVVRASFDAAFRTRLLETPHAALTETLGVAIPSTLRIRFVEKGPELDLLVVLPDLVQYPGELLFTELDAVLGGAAALLPMVQELR